MKYFPWLLSSAILIVAGACPVRAADSISIVTPADGATNLHCVVPIQVSVVLQPTEFKTDGAYIKITDNQAKVTYVALTASNGTTGNWVTQEDYPNGTYSLQGTQNYSDAQGYSHTLYSDIRSVTVKNGYEVNTDSTKTYAKVTLPTSGQTLTANGQTFTITSAHKVTFTRFDDCKDYYGYGQSKLQTTYQAAGQPVDVNSQSFIFQLPKQLGDAPTQEYTVSGSLTAGGPAPASYQNYAFTYWPTGVQVASGSSTFSMSAPPP